MDQMGTFHESAEDALREDIKLNGGFKKLGHELKPTKTPADAATWLRNYTNANQDEAINYRELLHILDKALTGKRSAFIDYLGQKYGFKVEWTDPESEAAAERRAIRESLSKINQRMERLERLETAAALQAVPR